MEVNSLIFGSLQSVNHHLTILAQCVFASFQFIAVVHEFGIDSHISQVRVSTTTDEVDFVVPYHANQVKSEADLLASK